MEGHIDSGVAFIFEGETEQVFYEALFYYFNGKNRNYLLSQKFDEKINEVIYYSQSSFRNIIIRTKTIGTITQIANTAQWFKNSCIKQYENIKWTIFLCYDTDSYKEDITMFNFSWRLLSNLNFYRFFLRGWKPDEGANRGK
jgi:hypothetical protein